MEPIEHVEAVALLSCNAAIEQALFDCLSVDEQAEAVVMMGVEMALESLEAGPATVAAARAVPPSGVAGPALVAGSHDGEDWVLVDGDASTASNWRETPTEKDAAVRLQATLRGRQARAQVDLTKIYIERLQEGQQANRSGEYRKARELFLEAYGMTGRAEPRISATNMRLKLFEVDEAIDEYEELLEMNHTHPGFLSPAAIGVVQKKIADARQLLALMREQRGEPPVQEEANAGVPPIFTAGERVRAYVASIFSGEDGGELLPDLTGCCSVRNGKYENGSKGVPMTNAFSNERTLYEAVSDTSSSVLDTSATVVTAALSSGYEGTRHLYTEYAQPGLQSLGENGPAALQSFGEQSLTVATDVAGALGESSLDLVSTVTETAAPVVVALGESVKETTDMAIENYANPMIQTIGEHPVMVKIGDGVNVVREHPVVVSIGEVAMPVVDTVYSTAVSTGEAAIETAGPIATSMVERARETGGVVIENAGPALQTTFQKARETTEAAIDVTGPAIGNAIEQCVPWVETAVEKARETTGAAIEGATPAFQSGTQTAVEVGGQAVEGASSLLEKTWGGISQSMRRIFM